MIDISATVGEGGVNNLEDVKIVQRLLNGFRIPPLEKLSENGIVNTTMIEAIRTFQKDFVKMTKPDGRVDPGKKTIILLGGLLPIGRPRIPDDSDIDTIVKAFAIDLNDDLKRLRTARQVKLDIAASGGIPPSNKLENLKFKVSGNNINRVRTPEVQAKLVTDKASLVCWSSHMTNNARHIQLERGGVYVKAPGTALGADFKAIKTTWSQLMIKYGLKNAEGNDGWLDWDAYHLELPDSKIKDRNDPRVQSCLDEYARLTRKEGKPENTTFEGRYPDLLKPHIEKYDEEDQDDQAQTISASVGRGGVNIEDDVRTVQTLLNTFRQPPLEQLEVNGIAGSETIDAIETFQRDIMRMASPDGRVDPGGRTIGALVG